MVGKSVIGDCFASNGTGSEAMASIYLPPV